MVWLGLVWHIERSGYKISPTREKSIYEGSENQLTFVNKYAIIVP